MTMGKWLHEAAAIVMLLRRCVVAEQLVARGEVNDCCVLDVLPGSHDSILGQQMKTRVGSAKVAR